MQTYESICWSVLVWGLLPVAFAFLLFCEFNRNKRRIQKDLMSQASSVLKALLASHKFFTENKCGSDGVLSNDLERILARNLIVGMDGFPMNITPTDEELKLAPHNCADAMAERIIQTSGLSRIADTYVVRWLECVASDLWMTKQSARKDMEECKVIPVPQEEVRNLILAGLNHLIYTCPESVRSFVSE